MAEFKLSETDLLATHAMLLGIKDGTLKVQVAAINKTLDGVRTDAVQEVYDDLNLTKTRIRKDFTINRSSAAFPTGRIFARGKPVGLISFSGTRQVKKGVSVMVKRAGARSVVKSAFIQTAKNARNVFRRALVSAGPPLVRVSRYPIERETGPRIEDILGRDAVLARVRQKAGERLIKNIDYEASRLLATL
jgi:hypothetical protein